MGRSGDDAITQPKLRALGDQDELEHQKRSVGTVADDWDTWWDAATSRPEYAQAVKDREETWAGKSGPTPKVTHGYHFVALRSAGFKETGIVWQYLNDLVVCGFK